ncbi:MAG: polysaccharide deacetylase family protein [Armatimonadota bacterium]|nr:polysaccharide deacetylase family protein [bacterium]
MSINRQKNYAWFRMGFEIVLVALLGVALFSKPTERHINKASWHNQVVYFVPTDQKVAALTFDDGPDPRFTPTILNELDKLGVKATFFMIGKQMEEYPDIVQDVIKRGHAIGNHTYTHPHDIEADTRTQVITELEECEKVIEKMTGSRTYLFRPPRGLVDGTVFTVAEDEGYRTILWTVCADHHDAPTPQAMAIRVLHHMRPGGIILAHDGTFSSRWKDVEATPLIINELKEQGYRFVTVPELLDMAKEPPTQLADGRR